MMMTLILGDLSFHCFSYAPPPLKFCNCGYATVDRWTIDSTLNCVEWGDCHFFGVGSDCILAVKNRRLAKYATVCFEKKNNHKKKKLQRF